MHACICGHEQQRNRICYYLEKMEERTNGLCDCVKVKELVRANMFKNVVVGGGGRTC